MSNPSGRPADFADPSSSAQESIQDFVPATKELSKRQIEETIREIKKDTRSKGFDDLRQNGLSQSEPFNSSDEGVETNRFRRTRSFEPSRPLPVVGSRSTKIKSWHPMAALVLASAAGLVLIMVSDPWDIRTSGAEKRGSGSNFSASLASEQEGIQPANRGVPKLVINEATPSPVDQPVPLGVSVHDANDHDFLVVSGFTKGTALSAGDPAGDVGWSLYAKDLNNALILPPPHFVGVMEVTVALVAGSIYTIGESQQLRFEWVAETVPKKKSNEAKVPEETSLQANLPEAKLRSQTIRQLPPKETAALLKLGSELVLSGDLAAARLVLRRAAQAGDAHAAFALAGTYDPVTLQRFPLHGLSPDLAMARYWYEKAKELESPDALRRLEVPVRRPD
jgi:hypothetical protein